jgi:hypothetical protein
MGLVISLIAIVLPDAEETALDLGLDNLNNVDLNGTVVNQTLVYDGSSWINQTPDTYLNESFACVNGNFTEVIDNASVKWVAFTVPELDGDYFVSVMPRFNTGGWWVSGQNVSGYFFNSVNVAGVNDTFGWFTIRKAP